MTNKVFRGPEVTVYGTEPPKTVTPLLVNVTPETNEGTQLCPFASWGIDMIKNSAGRSRAPRLRDRFFLDLNKDFIVNLL